MVLLSAGLMHVSAVSFWVGWLAGWSRMTSVGMSHLHVSFIPQQRGLAHVVAGLGCQESTQKDAWSLESKARRSQIMPPSVTLIWLIQVTGPNPIQGVGGWK